MKGKKLLIPLILFIAIGINSYGERGNSTKEVPNSEFKVYPNPVTEDRFTLVSEMDVIELRVLNVLGQKVYQRKVFNEKKISVELETTEKGLYLLQVKTADDRVTTKRILFK